MCPFAQSDHDVVMLPVRPEKPTLIELSLLGGAPRRLTERKQHAVDVSRKAIASPLHRASGRGCRGRRTHHRPSTLAIERPPAEADAAADVEFLQDRISVALAQSLIAFAKGVGGHYGCRTEGRRPAANKPVDNRAPGSKMRLEQHFFVFSGFGMAAMPLFSSLCPEIAHTNSHMLTLFSGCEVRHDPVQ